MPVRPLPSPAPDPQVVELLELALQRVLCGEVSGVAVVLVPRGGDVEVAWQQGEGCTVQALHHGAATLAADLLGCRLGNPGDAS